MRFFGCLRMARRRSRSRTCGAMVVTICVEMRSWSAKIALISPSYFSDSTMAPVSASLSSEAMRRWPAARCTLPYIT